MTRPANSGPVSLGMLWGALIVAFGVLLFTVGVWVGHSLMPGRVDYETCVANVTASDVAPEVCEGLLTDAQRARMIQQNKER